MGTVTIATVDFEVYGDNEDADEYHLGSYHGASWAAATEDNQNKALVTATRLLDRQTWLTAYDTFDARNEVPNIVFASYEIALALLDGSDVQNVNSMEERIQSMTAGSVSITNFRGIGQASRFPQIIQELLVGYLGGSTTAIFAAVATGVSVETIFPIEAGYTTGGM